MKKGRFYFIIILIVVVSVNVQAEKGLLESELEPLLIGRPYHALSGVKEFHVLIEALHSLPDEEDLDWKKLNVQVKEVLEKENIKVAFVTDTPNMTSVLPESVTGNLPSC
jgi:hypothetical protein